MSKAPRVSQKSFTREMETTDQLLQRIHEGDSDAEHRLFKRYQPTLAKWAHGRLPRHARGMMDTQDLVEVSLTHAFVHLKHFVSRGDGAFRAWLYRILMNQIRDKIRHDKNCPESVDLNSILADHRPSPIEVVIEKENMRRYEQALSKLTARERTAVVLRLEYRLEHQQVARAIGCKTPSAARMLVVRAITKLAKQIEPSN